MSFALQFKGFNYVAYYNGAYENADSLSALAAAGANSAALNLDFGINVTNNTVYADATYTDSLSALAGTAAEAVTDGLGVMVRPLIDFLKPSVIGPNSVGDWRAYYNPGAANTAGADSFFASYKTIILGQAQVAQDNGAASLCIGTELDQLTGPSYLAYWTDIISAVRKVFTGKLTYSADWNDDTSPWQGHNGLPAGTGDITTQVSFWNQLDYVGIDCYAPLSDKAKPTLTDLVNGWTQVPTDAASHSVTGNQSLISYFESIAATTSRPVIFTELGYESATDAASSPSGSATGVFDPQLQANLYQAFFTAWKQDGNSSLAGVYFWNWDPNAAEVGPGNGANFSPQGLAAQTVVETEFAACYAAGTRIATPAGEVAVEALAESDAVLTAHGSVKRIRWLGHRRVNCAAHPRPAELWPVRVAAHAFAPGQPHRPLFLSPDHAVLFHGGLIPIRYLINGATIVRQPRDAVTYWHVELDRHDILLAEGLPAESYLDTGNRAGFANGGGTVCLHPAPGLFDPDFARRIWRTQACAPLVLEGARLRAARSHLLARAETLGHTSTSDPFLHLVAGDAVLRGERSGQHYAFRVPDRATSVRLVSRSAVPAEIDDAGIDHRRLGVAVSRLAFARQAVELADARFGDGWHAVEGDGAWRWTDGDAMLTLAGGGVLEVEVAITLPYWTDNPPVGNRHAA